jgi:hypothetical protein
MIALAVAGQLLAHGLYWEGTATVHDGKRSIVIAVRTTIARDGSVQSDTWPAPQGEKRGLRRMIIDAGGGTMERGGKRELMPDELLVEERMQYGFYGQLQQADRWCREHPRLRAPYVVGGLVDTSFTCRLGLVSSAANTLAPGSEGSATIAQRFTFRGWWRKRGMVFPRHMDLRRSGKPYFTLDVTRFDAR